MEFEVWRMCLRRRQRGQEDLPGGGGVLKTEEHSLSKRGGKSSFCRDVHRLGGEQMDSEESI